jgi:hypothetical protein
MKLLPRIFCLASFALLAACSGGGVRDTLGMGRAAPDEFTVVSRPPLSVPPEFELKPPHEGEAPRVPSAEDQARQQLLGTATPPSSLSELPQFSADTAVDPVLSSEAPSGATASFLAKAGADKADDSVRDKLAQDRALAPEPKGKSLYEKIVGGANNEPVVDAPAESERLRSARDAGKPVTEGETPTMTDKPKSVIDQIF